MQPTCGRRQATGLRLVLHLMLHVAWSGCCEVQFEIGMGPAAAGWAYPLSGAVLMSWKSLGCAHPLCPTG